MFQTGLVNFLQNQTAITSLLGTTRADNTPGIFAMLAINEATMPYLTYHQVSNNPVMSLQGANRLQTATYRFSCYGTSYPSAQALAEALRLTFATYQGTWSDGTIVQGVMLENCVDDMESIPHGTIYACHLDFEFIYVDMT